MKKYTIYLAFFIPFLVYLFTACSSVSFFDSGELISSSFTLGISHPPGYPLYIMLSHPFRYLPLGNGAFKVVLFSSVMGALCCFIAYKITLCILDDLENKELLALIASLSFAFTYTVWSQSVVAEVYCLSTFIMGLSIFFLLKYLKEPITKYLYLVSFLFGISITAHYTSLVIFPIMFFFFLKKNKGLLTDFKVISACLSFFLFGLSTLLYLPFRAWQINALTWGDPSNLAQFLWLILRKGYAVPGPERTFSLFIEQIKSFNLYREFGILPLFFVIFGFVSSFRKFTGYLVVALIVILVLNVGVVIYGNPIEENIFLLESFHTPGYLILSVFIAVAVNELHLFLIRFKVKRLLFFVIFLVVIPASSFALNFYSNNWYNYHISYDYGKNVLKSCKPNSVLFTWGDSGAFPLWYLQYVEKYRTDVVLLHCPHLDAYWYWNDKLSIVEKDRLYSMWETSAGPENMVRFIIRELYGKRPLHIDYSTKYSINLPGLYFYPDGFVYTFSEDFVKAKKDNFDYAVFRGLNDFNELKDLDTEKAISIYAFCLYDVGVSLVMNNDSSGRELVKKAVELLPSLKPQAISVIGFF